MTAVRCEACGHTFSERAWRSQPVAQTLSARELSRHVVAWPHRAVVEVRPCGACGHPIARMVHALAAGAGAPT